MKSMLLHKITFAILLMIPPASLQAGSWSSGGGDLLKDANNPWFIQNTKSVTYCLEISETGFSMDKSRFREWVKKGLQYWQNEFKQAVPITWRPAVQPATQEFTETDCTNTTDLTFQFGVIQPLQEKYIGNPKEHIGIAVRTDYDPVQLKGRGFIYISPDHGPLSFVTPDMTPSPWSVGTGNLLYLILLHELGHVFGLDHQGRIWSLMSAQFPEWIVRPSVGSRLAAQGYIPSFFGYDYSVSNEYCAPDPFLQEHTAKYMGLPPNWECLRIEITVDSFKTFAKAKKSDGDWQPLGHGTFTGKEILDLTPVMAPYADHLLQKVFTNPRPDSNYLQGPYKPYFRRLGVYKDFFGGVERSFFANYGEHGLRAGGIFNGELISDFAPIPLSILPGGVKPIAN